MAAVGVDRDARAGVAVIVPALFRRAPSGRFLAALAFAIVQAFMLMAGPAVAGGATKVEAPKVAAPKGEIVLQTASGVHPITVEWAITEAEHERGLMFRKAMPADHGMIFVFAKEEPVYFWMHNTPLPLDMIFIAKDGTVRRIEKNATPYSDTVIPSGAPVSYVLEVNGGVADRLGLAAGDRVDLPPH